MKRRQIRATVLITMLVLSAILGQAQKYDSALAQLDANYPQEKLYLHFDKSAYNPGETIWFKAYVQVGNNASPFSRNLYSELLNEKGELLQRHITPIIKAGAASSFEIPASITDSLVYVRAYTRWMLNFDSAFLYTKTIPVLSVRNPSNAVAKKTVAITKLNFFPEGGDLVAGVQSRVAFKATDGNGIPVTIAGDITDSKGKKHASFTTQHDGMGIFSITPDLGETYTASFKDPTGKQQQVKLPSIQKTGLVLEINNVDGGLQFTVRRNAAATDVPSVVLVAQSQQQMLYQAKVNLTRSAEVKAVIPGDILPTGITQVTVFSEEGKPLAERIAFVNHQDYYFITDLNIPLKGTDKRARNVIQIDVPDTVECNLSISVTDATINPPHESDQDIYSHLLLASDIRGYVHNPGYYFSSESESVSRNLDLVMMTNGWRRFKWEDILADKWPVIKHPVEDYLTINGSVMGLSKSELTQKELTGIFTLKNGSQQVMVIPVSTEGKFSIPGLIFYDTAKMYYQFNNDQNKILSSKALINIKGDFLQVAPSFKAAAAWTPSWRRQDSSFYRLNRDMARKNIMQEEERRKVQTLAGVTVVARTKSKKEKMDEEYASGFFKGQDGYTFIMEDDPTANSAMSVFQYLQGKVAGLQITGAGQNTQLSWRGGSPSLFLNEMQSQMDVLQNTSMSDVAMIKVFRPPFFGGTGGGGGAIAVYTKKGAAANDNVKGLDFTNVPGYLPEKQFYSPDYSKVEPEHSNEDNRPTLFWNPNVFTDRNNRRIFYDVYNNDISKRLRIVVEGVNAQGKLTRIEKIIE